ncbi:hypothetical protein SNOG_09455 [Parastagonospora nodorum SN15]|uniref:Uncharacterized protein n=1 Tax=Phaeosphaeria nodorum (strain SN15 / ATCC MYA-4574 / FGSC 10173) TaxID=321614 RepID=Q0UFK9_PHANO|nr:hypothetical protein SNOG_09455 [Parastagonospora nodorum SN15]EAT82720.1 hypothetical protein SNOG_09455 [Parastagonospora nodorum SN15]
MSLAHEQGSMGGMSYSGSLPPYGVHKWEEADTSISLYTLCDIIRSM